MQAQKKVRLALFGKRHPVRQRHHRVIAPRQRHRPPIRDQQRLQAPRPIQRVFLFIMAVQDALRPRIQAAVPRINDQRDIALRRIHRSAHQRFKVLLNVQRVDVRLSVDDLRRETQMICQAVPIRQLAARLHRHDPVRRVHREDGKSIL